MIMTNGSDPVKRNVSVEVACEHCEHCIYFTIEQEGVRLIDGMRGYPVFKPHCKYLMVCLNLMKMMNGG